MHRIFRYVTRDMFTGLSERWHEACAQIYRKCDMRHVYNVIRNVTFAQGYQKCDLKHVYSGSINVSWGICTGLSEIWFDTSAQGYQKCVMKHVYKVVKNVGDMCTELSWMWQTCVHVFQKCDNRIYMIVRNVTWGMWPVLSEIWHETFAQCYQDCNESRPQGYQ